MTAAEVSTVEVTGMGLMMRFGADWSVSVRRPIGHRYVGSLVAEAATSYHSYAIGDK